MQRQRLSNLSRSKSSSGLTGSSPQSQKVTRRPLRDTRVCSLQVVFLSLLLAFVVSVILFAKTPDEFAYAYVNSIPGMEKSIEMQISLYGKYAGGPSESVRQAKPQRLSYDSKNFTLDGRPIRIVSGSVHYFRMVPSRWRPVLQYARAMGLNAIETYVPWNLHEPRRGKFRFSGILDLRAFLETAHEEGLLVLLRPGPYICSEWDLGGLPPFLLADDSMVLRSSHPGFMRAVVRYFDEVAKQIAPYIGKAVHAIQIENEYGAYGHEREYLHSILEEWKRHGFSHDRVMYFSSDNGGTKTVLNGSQFEPGQVLKTINLEHKVEEKVKMLRYIQPDAPAMIAEFWVGWFDHWGERHHVRNGPDAMREVRKVLVDLDASINLYVFFGGTNFGFMSGANLENDMHYLADVTSYDYDAYITEFGAPRKQKFDPMQAMLRKFWQSLDEDENFEATLEELPKPPFISAYAGPVHLTESISLYEVLELIADNVVASEKPLSMEEAGGDFGFVMYRHKLLDEETGDRNRILQIEGVRDFAYILFNGQVVKTVDRNKERDKDGLKKIPIPFAARELDIIVENRGRVNYGKHIHDRKGILGNITIDSKPVIGFETITMSFPEDHPLLIDVERRKTISEVRKAMSGLTEHAPMNDAHSPPTFFRGEMSINPGSVSAFSGELPGTHCRVYGRGVLWVNGFNVGRFHTGVNGPQRTLFVPGALLREGKNEFLVLHMNMYLAQEPPRVQLFDLPQLGTEA